MQQADLTLLLQWKRRQYIKLNEVLSATEELAASLDRNDQVAVNMWISMRGEPIQQVQELQRLIEDYLPKMPQEDAIRANELLTGAQAEDGSETALCDQVAKDRRLLERIIGLDEIVSRRLGGRRSFYTTYRGSLSST